MEALLGETARRVTPVAKKAYSRPGLVVYGKMADLTASGSGAETENQTGSETNPCTQDKNKAHC